MCLVYRKIKHNPPEFNGSRMYTFTPCGKCEDCLNHSRYAWAWRLTSDIQYYVKEKGYRVGFITLTYNDEHLPRFPMYLDDACEIECPLGGLPCFSKDDTQNLVLYLRKVLNRDTGMKDLVYFVASEYGPSTRRPHYHMIIAWPSHCEKKVKVHGHECVYGYDVTAEQMHGLIRHYWVEYKQAGFISPDTPQGGKSKRSGKKYLPFEVVSLNDCLNSCFYTAKYVTKDLYFIDELKKVVNDSIPQKLAELAESQKRYDYYYHKGLLDDDCYKELCEQIKNDVVFYRDKYCNWLLHHDLVKSCLPHHRQKKSLGFESIKSLSDMQKIELLNRGKFLLGNDKLSLPPLYIRNKIMFKPCYWIDKDGKRLVKQECTEFTKQYFDLIMTSKISYLDTLFNCMKDKSYWTSSGLDDSLADSAVRYASIPVDFGVSRSEAYFYYFGVPHEHCYKDLKFTYINRHRFPCLPAPLERIDYVVWKDIQEYFTALMRFCRWQVSSEPDYEAGFTRDFMNQPLENLA